MSDDIIPRLDRAMETAREKMIASILSWPSSTSALAEDLRDDDIDHYAALVALRARLDFYENVMRKWLHCESGCVPSVEDDLAADAERLLR